MKKFWKKVRFGALYILLAAVIMVGCFAAYPALTYRAGPKAAEYGGILRLWQIDSFEGGKGSRASFLNRAAKLFEEEHAGTLVLVTAHTKESAAAAVAEGNKPDMISFGAGTDFVGDIILPLRGRTFSSAQIGGETYAYPWCRGGYFLFTTEGDFSDVSDENTVLSSGGGMTEVAAYCAGLRGDFRAEQSVRAYATLLGGKYKYMLGTQRDVYRFTSREVAFQAKPLGGFCDLWQYISVCTQDSGKYSACMDFIGKLLSEEVQHMLPQVGMMSVEYSVYDASVPAMQEAEKQRPVRSLNAFLSEDALRAVRENAVLALQGDKNGAKNLENYLL